MGSKIGWKNIILLFIPGTLWGGAFLLTEIALETIPPFSLTAVRNLIATIPLVLLLYSRGGQLPTSWKDWFPFFIIGIFSNAFPFVVISWGQLHIDSGLASILVSTMPLFTIILAHFFIAGERLTPNKLVGIALGLFGVIVLIGPGVLRGLGLNIWGQLAVVAGSMSYAVGGIYTQRYLQKDRTSPQNTRTLAIIAGQFVSSTIFLLPLSLILEKSWMLQPTAASIFSLLALALPITIIPLLIYYHLIDTVGAGVAAITVYLIPINGVFWGALLLKEQVTGSTVMALLLILAGIAVVNGGRGQQNQPDALESRIGN
ncbi:MAG: EamA family transporter [Chloroflexi bacterium]|nr:EamA family transporter [Chloroflexota bacterium]